MRNEYIPIIAAVVALAQLALALLWIAFDRKRTYVPWFVALLLTFLGANGLHALTLSNPAFVPGLALPYALLAVVAPVLFTGGVLAFLWPEKMGWGSRLAPGLVVLLALQIGVVLLDVATGSALYFNGAATEGVVTSGLAGTRLAPWLLLLFWLAPALPLFVALAGPRNERRTLEIVLFATIVVWMGFQLSLPVPNVTGRLDTLSNAILSAGLLQLFLLSVPNLVERLSGLGNDWPISTKLNRGFASVLFLTMLVGLISIAAIVHLNFQVQQTLSTQNRIAQESSALLDAYREARRYERDFAIQARTVGLEQAQGSSLRLWQESVDTMAAQLETLRQEPLNAAQRERLRVIDFQFRSYLNNANRFFETYTRRGDAETGTLATWLTASELVDQLLNSNPVATRDFNERFVSLRNRQFHFLATESTLAGRDIREMYDRLQEYVLFEQLETPLSVRTQVQLQLEEEATAFDALREVTRELNNVNNSVEGVSAELDNRLLGLVDQASSEFDEGVAVIDERRVLSIALIIGSVAVGLTLATLLSQLVSRQITVPVLALADAANKMAANRQGVRAAQLSQDEIGVAARAFNTMAGRLEELLFNLEERVARRTAQLETAAEVAAAASGMHEMRELLDTTTQLLTERFGDIYHAQVFLVERQGAGEWAELRASTGAVGQQLLSRRHRLQVGGQSVIGQVTGTGNYVLARSYEAGSVHRPNELLPDTKSELAIPMKRGGRIIGALDVQSARPHAFSEDDVAVLQTLADQLAIAVENARLFRSLGSTLDETERLFHASSSLATASSKDDILDTFVEAATQFPELDRLTLLFFNELDADGRPIGATYGRSWRRGAESTSVTELPEVAALGGELLGAVQGGYFEVTDLERYATPEDRFYELFRAQGTAAFTVIPLGVLGLMILQRAEPGPLPEGTTRFFRVLAQQSSVALNRFALLERLSVRVDELQLLRESFLELSARVSLDELLDNLGRLAASLVEGDATSIYLGSGDGRTLRLVSVHNMDESLLGLEVEPGEGAAGYLMERREPFLIENYAIWSHRSTKFPDNGRYGSVAAIPLIVQDRLLGALTVLNMRDRRRLTQEDLRRLSLFADQAALAIENARLLRETERQLQETESLYVSTQALMGAGSEEEMLRAVAGSFGSQEGDIALLVHSVPGQDPPLLEIVATNDARLGERPAAEHFPVGRRLPATLLVPQGVDVWESTTRIVDDLPRSELAGLLDEVATFGLQGLMAAPIYTRDGFYGAILVLRQRRDPFAREELARAVTLASQFAVAYDNVLLVEQSQRAAAQLAAAGEVSRVASMQMDVGEMLPRAVDLIKSKFDYYHVQLFLVDPDFLWAELKASTGPVGEQLLASRHRLGVGSRSVIGQVTARGQHIVARSSEVDPDSVHRRNELLPDTQTELALPMKLGDQIIGALDVQTIDPFAFTDPADIEILQTLADQLAIAVQNARLFQQAQEGLHKTQELYMAGRALSDAGSLDEVLEAVLEFVAPADTSELSLLSVTTDGEGVPEQLRIEAIRHTEGHHGTSGVGERFPLHPDQRFLIQTLNEASGTLAVHDVTSDSRLDDRSREMYAGLGIEALLLTPMGEVGGRPLFMQAALSRARHIPQAELERFGTIVAQASIAIQKLSLLQTQALRAQRLDEANQLSSRLLLASNLEELLNLAAREITTLMEADQTGIVFYDRQRGIGRVAAQYRLNQPPLAPGAEFPISGNDAVAWLEEHRRPLAAATIQREPVLAQVLGLLESQDIRSVLMIPVFVRGEMVGTIGVDAIGKRRDWTDLDVSIAQALANLISAAIENARLFERVQQSLEQTEILYGASRSINESGTMNGIARAIAADVVREPDASVALLSLTLDANQLIRSVRIEGLHSPAGGSDRLGRLTYTDSTLPVMSRLDMNRAPIIVEDIAAEPRLTAQERRLFRLLGIGAILSVPIRVAEGWEGLILVAYPEARPIPASELERLQAISTQAATTMQNRELLVQTQESLLESQLLYGAGAAINESETAEGLLEALVPLVEPIDPDQVLLLLFDEPVLEGERPINFTTAAGLTLRRSIIPEGQSFRVRDFPIFRRLPVTAPLVFEDVLKSEFVNDEERQALRSLGLRSMLYLPLRMGTRYLGWIGFNASEPRVIPDSLVRRLQSIAPQTATALQSQQLFQEAQRRAWREEQISRITARLHSTNNPEEIMRIGLHELKRTLQIKRATAWMQPESNGNHDEA